MTATWTTRNGSISALLEERAAKWVMLEALTPRIYVRKYAVVAVELPTRAFMQTIYIPLTT